MYISRLASPVPALLLPTLQDRLPDVLASVLHNAALHRILRAIVAIARDPLGTEDTRAATFLRPASTPTRTPVQLRGLRQRGLEERTISLLHRGSTHLVRTRAFARRRLGRVCVGAGEVTRGRPALAAECPSRTALRVGVGLEQVCYVVHCTVDALRASTNTRLL